MQWWLIMAIVLRLANHTYRYRFGVFFKMIVLELLSMLFGFWMLSGFGVFRRRMPLEFMQVLMNVVVMTFLKLLVFVAFLLLGVTKPFMLINMVRLIFLSILSFALVALVPFFMSEPLLIVKVPVLVVKVKAPLLIAKVPLLIVKVPLLLVQVPLLSVKVPLHTVKMPLLIAKTPLILEGAADPHREGAAASRCDGAAASHRENGAAPHREGAAAPHREGGAPYCEGAAHREGAVPRHDGDAPHREGGAAHRHDGAAAPHREGAAVPHREGDSALHRVGVAAAHREVHYMLSPPRKKARGEDDELDGRSSEAPVVPALAESFASGAAHSGAASFAYFDGLFPQGLSKEDKIINVLLHKPCQASDVMTSFGAIARYFGECEDILSSHLCNSVGPPPLPGKSVYLMASSSAAGLDRSSVCEVTALDLFRTLQLPRRGVYTYRERE
ncbi:unnamed protein product [Prorocentrum cordatum]|uniref:Uncharacterized protein n=1 Tax=Prorocentrum cordatum TaxID=2364126 RepID=A0ABN9SDW9_9DINO|nr:unnamed protein product [Polarella glacialis]